MPVNPEVLRALINRYGKAAVQKAVQAAKTKVMVPNMTGTASAAAISLRDIPKTESTVGKEATVAATALASPVIVANPTVQKAATTLLRDLPAYEVIDRLPEVTYGGERLSEQGADAIESAYRALVPDGRFEEKTAPFVRGAGQAISMLPVGGLSDAAMRGLDSVVGKSVSKSLENAAAKEYKKALQTGYGDGLNHVSNEFYGTTNKNPIFGNGKYDLYYKDGMWHPVEGADTAGSAAIKYPEPTGGFDPKVWENWMQGHGYSGFKKPKDAFLYAWDSPKVDLIAEAEAAAGKKMSPQEYWSELSKIDKDLKKAAINYDPWEELNSIEPSKNLSFDSDIDKLISDLDLSVENITVGKDVQTALDKMKNKLAPKSSVKRSAPDPVFDEHGPWEVEHAPLYSNYSGPALNEGHVWNKPYIRIAEPKKQQLEQIKQAAHEGRIAPLETTVQDVFGQPALVSEDWAANLLTDEGKRQAPNGLMYTWIGNPGAEIAKDRGYNPIGKHGLPYWSDVYMGKYPSKFTGEHNLAKTYTGEGYSTAPVINYSTEGGAPNLLLVGLPKQPLYDTGINLEGMHWNRLFEPTSDNMAIWRQFLDEAKKSGGPWNVTGDLADKYNQMLIKNPMTLRGAGKFTTVDQMAYFLDQRAPQFGYNGILLRGLEDNHFGTGAHGELIWNPRHGGYPKAVHPASSLDLDWSIDNYLKKSGGPIHIKPENRGKFTALMKRTGKPASWFKAHGTPAQKKMATFALNAMKWKHEDGGLLDMYDDGTMLQYPDGGRIRGRRNGKYFVTELGNKKEQQFQDWYADTAAALGLNPNPDAYEQAYDYRGYWLNNRDADISSPDFHFPDTWKQPHHETFSNESVYAKGIDGVGHWEGDKFVPGYFNNVMLATAPKRPAVVEEAAAAPYAPSEDILQYIKDTEAFRDKWYQDGNGVWTIGYGFTGDDVRKRFPNGMTRAEADQYFADTVSRRVPMFISATPNFDKLNQNQRDALFSYYYNIGHGGYTRKSPTMQKALTDFDLDTVKANIDFGYNDKKNRGLRKRRDYERNLFATPMDYGGILNRLRSVYGDNESIKAAILRAKNVKK